MPGPLLSGIASFIVPGLGQLLNGKYVRAGLLFGLWLVVTASVGVIALGLFAIVHLVFIIASAIDAYRIAKSGLT
jgi:TM2 domain-containing membrane protein YozV